MQNMNSRHPAVLLTKNSLDNMQNNKQFDVKAGAQICKAKTIIASECSKLADDFICLNKTASSHLRLPGSKYRIYIHDKDSIYIGPVVGVMTTAVKNNNPPRGKTGKLFKEFIQFASRQGVFIYLFHPDWVDKKREYIKGLTVVNNKWKQDVFAWPDIIYNRIRFRKIENQKAITKLLMEFMKDKRVYLFNSRFLNKMEVYEALKIHPQGKQVVPDTVMFSRTSLEKMLGNYHDVFLKPIDGSIGRGIFKIQSVSPGQYCCAGVSSHRPSWKGPYSFDILYKWLISSEVSGRNYLVQQAVDLAKYKSRVFDVRCQVQKNYAGEWILTGAAVRVAGKNRFVTHIPNGGRAEVFEQVLYQVFPADHSRQSINAQLKDISRLVPKLLELKLDLNLAILSMDLGIDSNGRIWLLEVNSKPSSFDEDDIRMRHLQNLIDYCIYAAQKINRKGK